MQPSPMQPGAGTVQQPMYQPQYMQPHSPVDHLKPLASDFLLAVGAIIGIFLMMLGTLIYGLSSLHSDVYNLGKVIAAFGVFIVSVVLLMGAIVRIDLDKMVRAAYIIAAVVILVWIGFW
jgi:hypothetical protein